MAAKRKYSDEEVRAIIDHALENEDTRDVSHEDLVTIASEVGVSRESIEKAARAVETQHATAAAKSSLVRRRRRWLLSHAGAYLLCNSFLFAVNFFTSPGQWWVLFPVMIWGLALVFHTWAALAMGVSERAIARERTRQLAPRASRNGEAVPERRVRVEGNSEGELEADVAESDVTTRERLRHEES